MKKQSVYIETTIPSFYFSTRKSAKSVAWRQITRAWWSNHAPHFDLVSSGIVKDELSTAPGTKSQSLLGLLADVPMLPYSEVVSTTAEEYVRHKLTPRTPDAAHLALASIYSVDYLLTWNCVHLANANKARHIRIINDRLGLHTPFTLLSEVHHEEDSSHQD